MHTCLFLFSGETETTTQPLKFSKHQHNISVFRGQLFYCSFPIKILFVFVWRFNMDIRHIKITSTEGLYRINDKKAFKSLIVSIISSYGHNVTPPTARNTPEPLNYEAKWANFNTSDTWLLSVFLLQQDMIQFYQQNSLKEYFKEVDTTLRTPYKKPEESNTPNITPNTTPSTVLSSLYVHCHLLMIIFMIYHYIQGKYSLNCGFVLVCCLNLSISCLVSC